MRLKASNVFWRCWPVETGPLKMTFAITQSWFFFILYFCIFFPVKYIVNLNSNQVVETISFISRTTSKSLYTISGNLLWLKRLMGYVKNLKEKNINSSEGITCGLILFSSQGTCRFIVLTTVWRDSWLVVFFLTPIEAIGPGSKFVWTLLAWKIRITVEVSLNLSTFKVFCSMNYYHKDTHYCGRWSNIKINESRSFISNNW